MIKKNCAVHAPAITRFEVVAADIWKVLHQEGQLEFSALADRMSEDEETVCMALEWLRRDGLVLMSETEGKLLVRLRE